MKVFIHSRAFKIDSLIYFSLSYLLWKIFQQNVMNVKLRLKSVLLSSSFDHK